MTLLSLSTFVWAAEPLGPAEETQPNDARDVIHTIFEGQTPDKLVCDTTLRSLPDGSWVMVMLGGGDKEPSPRNRIFISRSLDQGRTWSEMQPIDFGVKKTDPNRALVPTELMVHGGRSTLYFTTHDGRFGDARTWQAHSDDSCRTWSTMTPVPDPLHKASFMRNHIVTRNGRIILPFQFYVGKRFPHNPRNGVMISDDDGKTWSVHGWIHLTDNDNYRGWAENNIVELADGTISMLIRADKLGGVLYRANSHDGGKTWPEFAAKTDIPNPGSKATLYPLGGDRVAILHNPHPKQRNPLSLWVSDDGMKTWPYRRVLVDSPGRLNYPDGFVSPDKEYLHFAFDDNRHRAVYIGAKLPAVE